MDQVMNSLSTHSVFFLSINLIFWIQRPFSSMRDQFFTPSWRFSVNNLFSRKIAKLILLNTKNPILSWSVCQIYFLVTAYNVFYFVFN